MKTSCYHSLLQGRLRGAALLLLLLPLPAHAGLEWREKEIRATCDTVQTSFAGTFHFRNTGSTPVNVTVGETSCDCTVADGLEKTRYEPGETGQITARVGLNGRTGQLRESVAIETDEDGGTKLTLALHVTVVERLKLRTHALLWARGTPPKPRQLPVRIQPGDTLRVVGVESSSPQFRVRLEPPSVDGVTTLVIEPDSTADVVDGVISLVTNESAGKASPYKIRVLIK